MSGLIKKNDAVEAMLQLERDDEEDYGARIPEGFDGARAVEALDKLPMVEPFTDAEKIFFDAVMRSERMTCREMNDSDGVNLCDEIIKKVRCALWT